MLKLRQHHASRDEVHGFLESIKSKVKRHMKEQELVNEVAMQWENVANRVVKIAIGEKMSVADQLIRRWWRLRIELM